MVVPSKNAMSGFASATELANRKLSVQSEILRGLGQKVQDWGKNTQWAGRQMMVGLTVPFAMGAAAAGIMANKIDASMVKVEKVVNEPLEGFRDKAMKTAKEITNSMGQTIESSLGVMAELAASGKTGQVLQDMTKLSQKMATLGDMDQQESIKGLISMQQIWKMNTKELSESIDYLNYVEDQTPTKLQDLVDAIPIAGVQVAQLGGTLQDTTILLTAFREKGIATVEGANAIKTAMNRIISPTKGAKETFKELTGKDLPALIKQTGGKPLETFQALSDVIMGTNIAAVDQQRIISKLVGTYQSSRITALLSGLRDGTAVKEAMKISQESPERWAAKTAKSLNAITDSASGQWKIALESFKAEFLQTGQIVLRVATAVVKAVTGVFTVFNNLPDFAKYILLGAGALLAIAGPITMVVGIIGNFLGTIVKVGAVFTGLRSKYKSMTLDEKLAELEAGNLNKRMLSQADTTQILIYQMGQLKNAYTQTATAAQAAAGAMNVPNAGAFNLHGYTTPGMASGLTMPIGGAKMPKGGSPLLGTNAWAGQTSQLLANSGQNMQVIATNTQKASKFAKVFNSEALIGVGAVTAMAGMVTETGSGLSDWLNWISLGSVALGAILPLVKGIGATIKGWGATAALGGAATKLGGAAKGFGSKLLAGGKAGLAGLFSFIKGPWGIGIGIALAAIFGVTKLIGAAQAEQHRHQGAIVTSTDAWMKVLGKTKIEWGQIRDKSGEVKDNIDAIVDKMRKEMPDLVGEMSGADTKYLQTLTEREALKLEGQGLNKDEIINSLDALLQAAGRSRKEIDKILGNIEVKFDFANGAKDLKAFIDTTKNDMKKELHNWIFEMPTEPSSPKAGERSEQQDQTADRLKGLFLDRLAGMDPVQKTMYADEFAHQMYDVYNDAFKKLDSQYGGKMAKNWSEARSKFFNFDQGEGKWKVDQEAVDKGDVNPKEVHQMEIMIDSEQRLTQAIARGLHVNDEKVKQMSVLTDIMPYVADGNITAKDAQEAYNKAIKEAKENGKEMTSEEKAKLAALLASQFGLDAATLANNGYTESGKKSADTTRKNAQELQGFINEIKNFAGATDDFWNSTTQGTGGFADALGGDVMQQASTLTDQVKGIYSGAMNDIYSAMADQAAQQWEARLEAITQSFEQRKAAVQSQIDRADKAYDAKQEAFQSRWDTRMEKVQKSYDRRQKTIEDTADKEMEAIDKQIDAEQEREDARQRQFEAEQKRIERLSELANRSIDYNRALATGNLDEAARVMNNAESVQAGWSADDAKDASGLKSKKDIDALNARKDLIGKQKQAKLDALKEEEEATQKSLERQRAMEQKSMERAREIERARLQSKLDGLSKEQAAAEKTERAKQEMDRRTLETELATLKAFVPQNEAELNAHVARVSSAYANYGLNLQTTGGYWGQIIGNALQNNVNRARQEMSSNAKWAAFGTSVSGAISKGAFGLTLGQFFNLIATGKPPKNWKPPGTSHAASNSSKAVNRPGGKMFFHDGGMVGTGSSTQGRGSRGNSPLGGDEVPTVLQKGEYVFPKSAVKLYGSEYLQRLAAGTPEKSDPGVGVSGMFGATMGILGKSMLTIAMGNLMAYAAEKWGMAGGSGAAVDFAKAQDGKPYMWGSAGPIGYDCSGYMSAIANVLTGKQNPYQRVFSTSMMHAGAKVGPFLPGKGGPFSIGVYNGNPGHTAGTLMGVNVESTGDHVRYGKDAHGADDKQFNMQFHVDEKLIAAGAAIPGFGGFGEGGMDKVQQRVKKVAGKFGWSGGAEWAALYQLVQHESGWNPYAANPTSSARGLFQKLTSMHGPIESTVEGQAGWGLNYIKGAYGDPINAWAKWQSRSPHWYDNGGDLPPGLRMLYNGTNQTESIVTHTRTSQLMKALDVANITYRGLESKVRSVVPSVSGAVAPTAGDTYNEYINVNVEGSGLTGKELETAIMNGIDSARIKNLKRRGKVK